MIVIDVLGAEEIILDSVEKKSLENKDNVRKKYHLYNLDLQLIDLHQDEDTTNHWLLYQHNILVP